MWENATQPLVCGESGSCLLLLSSDKIERFQRTKPFCSLWLQGVIIVKSGCRKVKEQKGNSRLWSNYLPQLNLTVWDNAWEKRPVRQSKWLLVLLWQTVFCSPQVMMMILMTLMTTVMFIQCTWALANKHLVWVNHLPWHHPLVKFYWSCVHVFNSGSPGTWSGLDATFFCMQNLCLIVWYIYICMSTVCISSVQTDTKYCVCCFCKYKLKSSHEHQREHLSDKPGRKRSFRCNPWEPRFERPVWTNIPFYMGDQSTRKAFSVATSPEENLPMSPVVVGIIKVMFLYTIVLILHKIGRFWQA